MTATHSIGNKVCILVISWQYARSGYRWIRDGLQ